MSRMLSIGSTPTLRFMVPFDPNDMVAIRIVFKCGNDIILEKNKNDLTFEAGETEGTWAVSFIMTQQETLLFPDKTTCSVQLHVRDQAGLAAVSKVKTFCTYILLKREVV